MERQTHTLQTPSDFWEYTYDEYLKQMFRMSTSAMSSVFKSFKHKPQTKIEYNEFVSFVREHSSGEITDYP